MTDCRSYPTEWDLLPAAARTKHPLAKAWTTIPIGPRSDIAAHLDQGGNVCNRLRADQLVVDVDPKRFPSDQPDLDRHFFTLYKIDPFKYPRADTPNGGYHLRMRKPPGLAIRNVMPDGQFPGIDLLSIGRQVVASGSVAEVYDLAWDEEIQRHVKVPSGIFKPYTDNDLHPPLTTDLPDAPESLLAAIARPEPGTGGTLAGDPEYLPQDIEDVLSGLDVRAFREYDDWHRLGMAVHAASRGQAREEWIEWCAGDPSYASDRYRVGRHWDSWDWPDGNVTSTGASQPITYRTLGQIAGAHKVKIPAAVTDRLTQRDFPADMPDELEEAAKKPSVSSLILDLNDKYAAILDLGGKFRVLVRPERDDDDWTFLSKTDFFDGMASKRVYVPDKDGNLKEHEIAKLWFASRHRREFRRVAFQPAQPVPDDVLNLWRGWGTQPIPGEWYAMQDLIENTLSDGDPDTHRYVYRWMAYMFQHPDRPAGTALAFRGDQGTGKGTLGNYLVRLIGRHAKRIGDSHRMTGRFNRHLMDCVFLFADEAVRPTDKAAKNVMKGLITEPTIDIEPKGVDTFIQPNCLHVMIASNDHWFLSMEPTGGERRYMVSEVSNNRKQDIDFFEGLRFEMDVLDGMNAMLHDLLSMDIGGWTPYGNIPKNAAYVEQSIKSLPPTAQWIYQALCRGGFGENPGGDSAIPWPPCDPNPRNRTVSKTDMRDDFKTFCRERGINWSANGRGDQMWFTHEIKRLLPSVSDRRVRTDEGRTHAYSLPPLDQARDELQQSLNIGKLTWGRLDNEDDVC